MCKCLHLFGSKFSNFNYRLVIWHFRSEANVKKVEIIHERALRFIYNENYSTYMRMHTIAIETFKIVDKERPLLVDDQLSPSTNYRQLARYSRAHTNFLAIFWQTTITNGDKADSKVLHFYLG
jgi:hypothetical protein